MRYIIIKIKPYKDLLGSILGLVAVFAALLIVFYVFDLSNVQSFVDRFGIFAPIAFILTKAATIVFAPLSGSPLYPIAGALFGFWHGFFFLIVGDMLGGSIAFYISRVYGIKIVERFVKSEASLLHKILGQLGTLKGFIFARFCFIPMPEVVCYAAGLTTISFKRFITIHFLIDIPMTAILVAAGALVTFDISPFVIIALFILGTLATVVGGIWFYKYTK